MFSGQKLDITALSDYSRNDRRKLETLRQNKVMEGDRLLTFATVLGLDEADIEDVFNPSLYSSIVNLAFELPAGQQVDANKSCSTQTETQPRLVKKMEAYFGVLPPGVIPSSTTPLPAEWVVAAILGVLDGDTPDVVVTLERAEKVISALNKILKP